jgi:hypothetical protein
MIPRPPPQPRVHYSGDVHWIDHSIHSGPQSKKTLKDPHFAVILTNNNLLARPGFPLVAYVPMTSFKPEKHWDNANNRLRYAQDVLLKASQYPALTKDTIIDCGQIFTCDYECFNDWKFRLNGTDLKSVRARVAYTLGYN